MGRQRWILGAAAATVAFLLLATGRGAGESPAGPVRRPVDAAAAGPANSGSDESDPGRAGAAGAGGLAIRGRALLDGKPAAGLRVRFVSIADYPDGAGRRPLVREADLDAEGRFRLSGVAGGRHFVELADPEGRSTSSTPVDVAGPGTVGVLAFASVDRRRVLAGTVRTPDGEAPVAGAELFVFDGRTVVDATSDAFGRFEVATSAVHAAVILAGAPGLSAWRGCVGPGEGRFEIDVTLPPRPWIDCGPVTARFVAADGRPLAGARIAGTEAVTDAAGRVEIIVGRVHPESFLVFGADGGAGVATKRNDRGDDVWVFQLPPAVAPTVVIEGGEFEELASASVSIVPGNRDYLSRDRLARAGLLQPAYGRRVAFPPFGAAGPATVRLSDGEEVVAITEVDFSVPGSADAPIRLSLGRGVLSGRVVDACGRGVAGAVVTLPAVSGAPQRRVITGAGGELRIEHLPDGERTLLAESEVAGTTAASVVVQSPGTVSAEIALPPVGVVRGLVVTSAGDPVPGEHVSVVDDPLRRFHRTDDHGRFEIRGLPRGKPVALDLPGPYGAVATATPGGPPVRITWDPPLTPTVDAELRPYDPLPLLRFQREPDRRIFEVKMTRDATGRPLLDAPVPAGRYRLTADPPWTYEAPDPLNLRPAHPETLRLHLPR